MILEANTILLYILIFIFLLISLVYFLKKKSSIDSPIAFAVALYILYFAISPLFDVLTQNTLIGYKDMLPYYYKTELLFVIGFVFFLFGYTRKISLKNIPSVYLDTKKLIIFALGIETLSVLTYYLWTKQMGIPFFVINPLKLSNFYLMLGESSKKATGYLSLSLLFLIPSSLMMLELFIRKKLTYVTAAAILFNFILFFTRGVRYMILIYAGSLFLYYIRRKNVQIRKIHTTIGILFTIVLFSLIAYLRGAPSLSALTFNIDFILAFFSSSFSLFKPTAALLYYIPMHHYYLLGESFIYIFLLPIPRILWPQKPYPEFLKILWKITGGRFFGYAVPNIGEYYANFGIAGVIVFMAFLGILFNYIYELYKNNEKEPLILMSYSIFYFFIFQIISRGYFPQIFVQGVYLFTPLLFLYLVSEKRKT